MYKVHLPIILASEGLAVYREKIWKTHSNYTFLSGGLNYALLSGGLDFNDEGASLGYFSTLIVYVTRRIILKTYMHSYLVSWVPKFGLSLHLHLYSKFSKISNTFLFLFSNKLLVFKARIRERSFSVVECLTTDIRAARSSLTGVTVLCTWARHINPCLVLVQPRKTRPT